MKIKLSAFLFIASIYSTQLYSQTYWEVAPWVFDTKKTTGIELKLGKTDKLTIYTNSATTIGNETDFKQIINSFFENLNPIKDSLNNGIAYKVYFYYDPKQKPILSIAPQKPKNKRFIVVNEKPIQVYENQNQILIFPKNENGTFNVFEFQINEFDDLLSYSQTDIINSFIEKLNTEIKQKTNKKPATSAARQYFKDDFYPSSYAGNYFLKNDSLKGYLKSISRQIGRYTLAPSVSTNIQNYKNIFAPSFNVGFDIHIKSVLANSIMRIGVYWEPMFTFEKGADKTRTFRNDFVGIIYETKNYKEGEKYNTGLTLYAPMSIAYLVNRNGNYFDKNTFQVGIGGVKYGSMTLRPFMYFNNFFKNISPAAQLSLSFGR